MNQSKGSQQVQVMDLIAQLEDKVREKNKEIQQKNIQLLICVGTRVTFWLGIPVGGLVGLGVGILVGRHIG